MSKYCSDELKELEAKVINNNYELSREQILNLFDTLKYYAAKYNQLLYDLKVG